MRYKFVAYTHRKRWVIGLLLLIIGTSCKRTRPTIEPDDLCKPQEELLDIKLEKVEEKETLSPTDPSRQPERSAKEQKKEAISQALTELATCLKKVVQQAKLLEPCKNPETLKEIKQSLIKALKALKVRLPPDVAQKFIALLEKAAPNLQTEVPNKENLTTAARQLKEAIQVIQEDLLKEYKLRK